MRGILEPEPGSGVASVARRRQAATGRRDQTGSLLVALEELGAELLRTARGCLDGVHEGRAQAPCLQRVQAGDGGAARTRHLVLEAPGVLARLDEELGRAEHGLRGE